MVSRARTGGTGDDGAVDVLRLLWAISGLDVLMLTRADTLGDVQHVQAALVDGRATDLPDQVWSGSLCTQLAAGTGPAVAPDIRAVPAYARAANVAGTGLVSYVGALVVRADGSLYGTVCGFGRTPGDDTMHDLLPSFRSAASLLGGTIAAAQLADERLADARRVHTRLLRDALTDPVTGLLNRTGLEQATAREQEQQLRYGHVVTVVVCDVDGLKQVNDTAGHAAGDDLLHAVAQRLRATTRPRDVLGRAGGDEFVLLLPEVRLDGPGVVRVRGALRDLPVSVGAADTAGGRTLEQARVLADATMYRAKGARRSSPAPGRTPDHPPIASGTVVLGQDGVRLGTVHQVFRELASGHPSWATVRTGAGHVLVAVPLAGSSVVDTCLVLPHPGALVLGAPRLRSARVMTERERLVLADWYALS